MDEICIVPVLRAVPAGQPSPANHNIPALGLEEKLQEWMEKWQEIGGAPVEWIDPGENATTGRLIDDTTIDILKVCGTLDSIDEVCAVIKLRHEYAEKFKAVGKNLRFYINSYGKQQGDHFEVAFVVKCYVKVSG